MVDLKSIDLENSMKSLQLILFITIFAICAAKQWPPELQAVFKKWKETFNKTYASSQEEQFAMDKMLSNHGEIEAHNKKFHEGKSSFDRGLWKQSDKTLEEKKQILTSKKALSSNSSSAVILQGPPKKLRSAALQLNWVGQILVKPRK